MKKDLAAYGRIVNKWCRKKETYAPLIADLLRDCRKYIVLQIREEIAPDWRLCRRLITSREML